MKRTHFIFSSAAALLLGSVPTAHAQMAMSKPKALKTLNVAVLVYPDVEVLDMSGSIDVFSKASEVTEHSFNVFTVGQSRTPFKIQGGSFTLTPQFDLATCPHPDIIVVPGSGAERVAQVGSQAQVQKWLRANSKPGQTVMSVCTGAFIIGRAGLLDNRKSTTHWFSLTDLQRQFPKTKAFSGVRFMRDGNVISTAGVSSGIDGALQLVEDTRGKPVADLVARVLQYRPGTPSYPKQPRERVKLQNVSSTTLKPGQTLALDHDPVCQMKLGARPTNTFTYQGKVYGFCSSSCRDTFAAHPDQFLKSK